MSTKTGGKGWLGGSGAELEAEDEERKRLEQKESSQKVYDVLKKNKNELSSKRIGLNGDPIEMSPFYSDEEEIILLDSPIPCPNKEDAELPKKGPVSLEHIMRAIGILSSFLRELIAIGVTQSWINKEGRPDQKFVDIEGGHLKETIEMLVPLSDRKAVYEILRNEVSAKKEKDRIVGDILLKFAFHLNQ